MADRMPIVDHSGKATIVYMFSLTGESYQEIQHIPEHRVQRSKTVRAKSILYLCFANEGRTFTVTKGEGGIRRPGN